MTTEARTRHRVRVDIDITQAFEACSTAMKGHDVALTQLAECISEEPLIATLPQLHSIASVLMTGEEVVEAYKALLREMIDRSEKTPLQ